MQYIVNTSWNWNLITFDSFGEQEGLKDVSFRKLLFFVWSQYMLAWWELYVNLKEGILTATNYLLSAPVNMPIKISEKVYADLQVLFLGIELLIRYFLKYLHCQGFISQLFCCVLYKRWRDIFINNPFKSSGDQLSQVYCCIGCIMF